MLIGDGDMVTAGEIPAKVKWGSKSLHLCPFQDSVPCPSSEFSCKYQNPKIIQGVLPSSQFTRWDQNSQGMFKCLKIYYGERYCH